MIASFPVCNPRRNIWAKECLQPSIHVGRFIFDPRQPLLRFSQCDIVRGEFAADSYQRTFSIGIVEYHCGESGRDSFERPHTSDSEHAYLGLFESPSSEPAFDLMVGGPRCATVVTTRSRGVANEIAPTEDDVQLLDVLTEDNAVKLLKELAASVVSQNPAEARELAKELERLPLALNVAGRLLREEQQKGLGVTQLLEDLRDPAS